MVLFPETIVAQLLNNGAEPDSDPRPVVKLFDPCGAATWLLTEMLPTEPDLLFGLCDLGMGAPELGYVRRSELERVTGKFGLGLERDLHFVARFPLSVYAEASRIAGQITESDAALVRAAAALAAE